MTACNSYILYLGHGGNYILDWLLFGSDRALFDNSADGQKYNCFLDSSQSGCTQRPSQCEGDVLR